MYKRQRADFDFDRGSNAAATRVNADGLIEKYRENKLLQSNQFDTTWSTSNASVTSGQIGYDGSNNAWLLSANADFANINQTIALTNLVTFSVYAKAGTGDWLMMRLNGSANNLIYVDVANQVFGNTSPQYVDGTITDLGSGWRRVSVTINQTSYNNAHIYVAEGNGSISTTNETIYIQNAQLESGLVATDYLESTSVTGKAGVLIDLPRIDYSSGAGALLLEPQRANLYQYSEYYDAYSKTNCTITSNATTSPEGLQNASKIVSESGGPNIKRIQPSISTTGTNEYIISAFAKKAEWDYLFIYGAGTLVNGSLTIFNLDNGTIEQGSAHASIEAFGDDGWYKITWKATSTGTGTGDPRIGITDNSSSSNSTGDGVSGVYLYGLQIEQASYSTSYIPNHGESGGVTRAADSCLDGGSAESINSTEGVLYAEISALAEDVSYRTICIHDGTNTQRINIWYWNDGTFKVDGHYNNVQQFNFDFDADLTALNKIAVKYKANDFSVFLNGSKINSDTSGATPVGLNTLDFRNGNNLYPFYGNVKQVAVFNEALSDSELATLTTL